MANRTDDALLVTFSVFHFLEGIRIAFHRVTKSPRQNGFCALLSEPYPDDLALERALHEARLATEIGTESHDPNKIYEVTITQLRSLRFPFFDQYVVDLGLDLGKNVNPI